MPSRSDNNLILALSFHSVFPSSALPVSFSLSLCIPMPFSSIIPSLDPPLTLSSCGLPPPLRPNPLKDGVGWEFNRRTTRIEPDQPTKRQKRSPPSSPSSHASIPSASFPSPPPLSLPSPLAFISGDKGLQYLAAVADWRAGWRNLAHHHFCCILINGHM